MKIYTHDDVIKMMDTFHTSILNRDLCMAKLTPIELPIEEKSEIPINLYTEEQVREAFILGMESSSKYSPKSTFEEFIQSLKQHKQ